MDRKPEITDFLALCPDVGELFARDFLDRLEDEYFVRFSEGEVVSHARAIAGFGEEDAITVLSSTQSDRTASCTVIASDYPGIFSVITGLLSASGFAISEGDIFTYAKRTNVQSKTPRRARSRRSLQRAVNRGSASRRIIDVFHGTVDSDGREWEYRFRETISEIYGILKEKSPDALVQARKQVDEAVAVALSSRAIAQKTSLMPVEIDFDTSHQRATRMTVTSQDTPFFLFSLSNALSLHDVSIERVEIRTIDSRIQDEIRFVDLDGHPVTDSDTLSAIKLSAVFTKQFTYFLGDAPDPFSALARFDTIIQDIRGLQGQELRERYLSNPRVLQDLATLLGASDFLWEDFIRTQYESLLPVLTPDREGEPLSTDPERLSQLLAQQMKGADSLEERVDVLNAFKDREAYLIDLEHIISRERDFFFLSSRLTSLAELVVNTAVRIAYHDSTQRFGEPRGYAGIAAKYAVMGLGKLGGEALGYASDIELLFVYSDNGTTDGPDSITNAEFFERCFKEATGYIKAKREGIFQVDLRLRPHGNAGPIACSLESFFNYYGSDGQAHNLERLALVRMRAIGGDAELGARIERIRDEMVYATEWIDTAELRAIREVQLREKTSFGKVNAKFSPGGLVDLEYTVQIIQCMYGRDHPELRTSSIHTALAKLVETGYMSGDEADRLVDAYRFMRDLINGLRMLRGSAMDLFLPAQGSDEYVHLARRMGYRPEGGLTPAQILHFRFDTKSADIRSFIENHFGRDSIPGPEVGNAADLVLSKHLSSALTTKILTDAGFSNVERALRNIRGLAGDGATRLLFARLAVLAFDVLDRSADPDMALNNWERFVSHLPDRAEHFRNLLSQPGRLEILLAILSGSQFLADTLVGNADFLEWVTEPSRINRIRSRGDIRVDLAALADSCVDADSWLAALRKFRKREILRIGTRDICLSASLETVTEELSNLAEAILERDLLRTWGQFVPGMAIADAGFCILAFGKLGGRELNYSSDIDLIATYDEENVDDGFAASAARVVEQLRADLSNHSAGGYVYRVDLRLRPYGTAGPLVQSTNTLISYYRTNASPWELQALLKLRPVAGDLPTGERLIETLWPLVAAERGAEEVAQSIDRLRALAIRVKGSRIRSGIDVKSGRGGIRDIEFLLQGLQMIHLHDHPAIRTANTLEGLEALRRENVLPADECTVLADDYRFLRRLEHFLQVFDDRQTHILPEDAKTRESISRRLGVDDGKFDREIEERMERVRDRYERYLLVDSP